VRAGSRQMKAFGRAQNQAREHHGGGLLAVVERLSAPSRLVRRHGALPD
jgi:hypothetical protein